MARPTAVVIGPVAIPGGIVANGQNVAFLVALAFAVAASANLPTILYSCSGRGSTERALWSIYGGLGVTVLLIVFSPVVSGKPIDPATGRSPSMLQGVDFHWFPLDNPGLVSIPLSFLLGAVGRCGQGEADAARRRGDGGPGADRCGRGAGGRALRLARGVGGRPGLQQGGPAPIRLRHGHLARNLVRPRTAAHRDGTLPRGTIGA